MANDKTHHQRAPLLLLLVLLVSALVVVKAEQKVKITIPNTTPSSQPITPNFASFSVEWSSVSSLIAGGESGGVSSIFVRLMQNLKNASTIAPLFRIGGNSADESWWNPNNMSPPSNKLKFSITHNTLSSLRAAAEALNSKFVMGLNFIDGGDPRLAVDEAKAIGQYLSWKNVAAVEIGNEPDLFAEHGLRPSGWTYHDYKSEFEKYADSLKPYLPAFPFVQGATFCCKTPFLSPFSDYIREETASCKTYSRHIYPESACGGRTPTLGQLLSNPSAEGAAQSQKPNVLAAISVNRPYWVGETNSISCGGEQGVSDVFGAALWASDYLFNLVNVGVSGANFHQSGSSPYDAYNLHDGGLQVKPLFYGMLFFSEAIGYIPHVTSSFSSPPQGYLIDNVVVSSNDLIRVWSVIERRTNSLRIIIIHKDIQATQQASITIKVEDPHFASRRGVLLPLEASGPLSKTGIRLAGQTFDGSDDGSIQGTFQPIGVNPNGSGEFSFKISPTTAAMLVIT